MAPVRSSKRPRAPLDDDDSVEEGSTGRGKRPRRSLAEDSSVEESSDEETPQSDDGNPAEDERNTQTDELYNRQTQRLEKQLKADMEKKNTPADCGIIQEISCTNFMCHEQLTVTLGPLINFIIGHNGSGKSAVLTALTLCLGGKATATNRGQNLKSFIKEGTDHCTLRVKIKNQGPAAFKPDIYGKSVIVERHFNRAGTSGFRLKDENKKLVSTKKADLEDVIDAFALQIDNPMNVLTQDMARQFLNDSTPRDKYKFFLKGTQLQALQQDYNLMSDELESMQNKSITLKEDLEILHKQFNTAVAKAQRAQNLATMRAREQELAHQAAWATVEADEAELKKIDGEIERVSAKIEEKTAAADEQSERFEMANRAWSELNQSIQDKLAEIEPKEQERLDLDVQWKETKAKLISLNALQRDIRGKIENKEKQIAKYKQQIEDHRKQQAEADGGQHAQKLAELEQAKEDSERAQETLTDHDSGFENKKRDLASAKKQKMAVDVQLRDKQQELQRSREAIRQLEQGQRDWTDPYPQPDRLRSLIRAIDNERRFRERPVGPMGRYVKLLKPEWSSILERSFGASLNAFVVTSKDDQTVLSDMMRRMNCNYPVFIGRNTQIDTSGHEPDPQLDTWMRVLTFTNNLVRNQLIINHAIDQTVLIADRKQAQDFMHAGGPPRRNVKLCFTMADGDTTKGHAITLNPHSGNISIGPIMRWQGDYRMQADKEPQLRSERSILERNQRNYDDLRAAAQELQAQVDACQGKIEDHDRQKRNLVIRSQKAQAKYERLEADLSAATPDAGVIEVYTQQLKEAEEEKSFEEGQKEDILVDKAKYDAESRAQRDSIADLQRQIDQLNIELGKAQAKADKLKTKREEALREKNRALEAVEKARANKDDWEQHRGRQLATVEESVAVAEQICNRVAVPAGETYDSLVKKLERHKREREEIERELGGSEKELYDNANAKKREYHVAKKRFEDQEETILALKRAHDLRQQRWELFRQEISIRARITFTYLLSERQFRGELKVDHKDQQLDIHVQPDITVASGAGRQTKTLSGGEKSFSTICLLLALWDAMGSPIRCLDEFDVFMDSVNRDISMKMMIGAARRAIGRQYILITPQAMQNIASVDDVKIIRMLDPERGQTALNMRA